MILDSHRDIQQVAAQNYYGSTRRSVAAQNYWWHKTTVAAQNYDGSTKLLWLHKIMVAAHGKRV
jgi:hypothetical protein